MYNNNEAIVKEIALEDIKLKIQASFFMLLSNAKMLKDEGCWNIPYKADEKIKVIENKIIECILNLDSFFKNSSSTRDNHIKTFISLKKEFVIITESIYCYFYYNEQLKNIVDNHIKLSIAKENKEIKINNNMLYDTCINFINNAEFNGDKISHIMSILPIEMTDEEFINYIENSLIIKFKEKDKDLLNNLLTNLKLKFLSKQMPNYGIYYPQITDKLNTISNIDMYNLTYNELFEVYESLVDNLDIFSEIEDYLSTIYESINYIIYILTFSHDIDFILEENLIYKDIFYSCKNSLNGNLNEELKYKLDDLISDTCERLVDIIIDIEKSKSQIINNIKTKNLSTETLEMLKIDQIITDAYYETLLDVVYPINLHADTNTSLDTNLINTKIKEFLTYIKLGLKTLNPQIKALTKQLFLENIPSPFNLEEFKEYLNNVLKNINGYQKTIIMDALDNLLTTQYNHMHNNKKR